MPPAHHELFSFFLNEGVRLALTVTLRALITAILAPLGLHLPGEPRPAGPGFLLSFLSFFASQAVSGSSLTGTLSATVAERRTMARTSISRCLTIRGHNRSLGPAGAVLYTALHRRPPPTVPLLRQCPLKLKLQELATVSSARPQYLQACSALGAGLRPIRCLWPSPRTPRVSSARPRFRQARSALSAGLRQAVQSEHPARPDRRAAWTSSLFWTRMADRLLF